MQGLRLTLAEFIEQAMKTADTKGALYENRYIERLQVWEEWKGEGNIHITCAEQMFEHGKSCMDSIFEYLGLDPDLVTDRFPAANRGAYPNAPTEIIERLQAYFAPWNERLFDHVGADFGWNSSGSES